ncbi:MULTISPECIES: ATP-binding protein [unclassified Streptomyces]|uniref:ATP-binding protein n=1 Tax=unclassified Streptomyces TaxID=2593676 RepID=UPI0033B8C6F8
MPPRSPAGCAETTPVELLAPGRLRAHHTEHRNAYAHKQRVRPLGAGLDLYGLRKDGTEFQVEISLSPLETADGLLVSAAVHDVTSRRCASRVAPQPRLAADDDESGRGPLLVRALAHDWGVRPTDEGKTTWFGLTL